MPTESQAELAYATEALDFHRAITVPAGPVAASRTELDGLHRHLLSLYALFDAHTTPAQPLARAEADQLRAARIRIWQAAEHLHGAFHAAPRPCTGLIPSREECRSRAPTFLRPHFDLRSTDSPLKTLIKLAHGMRIDCAIGAGWLGRPVREEGACRRGAPPHRLSPAAGLRWEGLVRGEQQDRRAARNCVHVKP
ncbi:MULTISPECIES: DUF6238 family protein [unclassified Streptomyces]|uniref:DUF6238 family protein n=1 Tax=unclassified Streptomyces TaxID=2593676 RepID=UPI003658FCB6